MVGGPPEETQWEQQTI